VKLDTKKWKEFYLNKLYEIKSGNKFDKNKLDLYNPEVNLVSRVSYNNGVDVKVGFVDNVEPYEKGELTVALGGSYLGSCFVQEEPFYTAQNVAVMKSLHKEMTHSVNLFISALVRFESKKKFHAFGRELNTHIKKDFSIRLPIQQKKDGSFLFDPKRKYSEEGYIPDWNFMQSYIEMLGCMHPVTENQSGSVTPLNIDSWKYFVLDRIMKCERTTLSIKSDLLEGQTPFISRTALNNGCDGYVEVGEDAVSQANCITVGAEGIYAFYQPYNFASGNKVYTLRNSKMNKFIGLFLCTVLNKEAYRYSYGRARVMTNLKKECIKLPIKINANGTPFLDEEHVYSDEGFVPDFEYMENYMKSLPYGDCI